MNFPTEKFPTAKKYHCCDACNHRIVPGDKYAYLKFFHDGMIEPVKFCLSCYDIYQNWHTNYLDMYGEAEDLIMAVSADATMLAAVDKAEAIADARNDEEAIRRWEEEDAR